MFVPVSYSIVVTPPLKHAVMNVTIQTRNGALPSVAGAKKNNIVIKSTVMFT